MSGFYMMGTLTFNELIMSFQVIIKLNGSSLNMTLAGLPLNMTLASLPLNMTLASLLSNFSNPVIRKKENKDKN